VATPAIALVDTDYYGPGMSGPLRAPSGVLDSNSNNLLTFSHVASAVNYIDFVNAAINGTPNISAKGSDTNINLGLAAKGSKQVVLTGGLGSTTPIAIFNGTTYQHLTFFAFPNTAATRNISHRNGKSSACK
jgi:hypothetical protein